MKIKTFIFILAFWVSASMILMSCDDADDDGNNITNPADMPYSVDIDAAKFENLNITGNTFFPLNPGITLVYEGEDADGIKVRIEEIFTSQTKVILGVTCRVAEFKEYEDGALIEETLDWYGQDKEGNVWYFGEDSKDIEDGQVVSTAGSWEAGVDGALPGIIMLASPIEGLWYRQEFYEGEAEDVSQVLSLNQTVTVPSGTYQNCLQAAEWTPLEPGIVEHKFYAPGVGLVRVVKVEGAAGFEDLVEINP